MDDVPARTSSHTSMPPESSWAAGQLRGGSRKPNPQCSSYKPDCFEEKKKSLKGLLGWKGFSECSYLDATLLQR